MKKKSLLDSIDVPVPCDKSWDEMLGGDVSRFCSSCEKDIYNISAMTRREAKKLLFQSSESVCIRLEKEADGRIKTLKKQLHQITRQVPLAAGVLTASLILSGAANAQKKKIETAKITVTQIADAKNSKPTISGIITDSNGAVIPSVKVILRNVKDNSTNFTVSDADGFYEFRNVEPAIYEIEIAEQNGFKKFIYNNLVVASEKSLDLKIALESEQIVDHHFIENNVPVTTETPPIDDKITPRQIESLPINSRKMTVLGLFPGVKEEKPKKQIKNSQISITVVDQNDALVVNAKIILKNGKLKKEYSIFSNDEGLAKLNEIIAGDYKVEITANGFKKYKGKIKIKETVANEIKIALETGNVVVGVSISKP
jgi:hypothetical protein